MGEGSLVVGEAGNMYETHQTGDEGTYWHVLENKVIQVGPVY